MNIVHFDRVVWFVRNQVFDFYFLFQYLSKCFWNLLYWDICIFTQFNLLNTISTFWSNSLRFPDFNFISYFDRNIYDSINVNNFCRFLGRIILFIDFNYWIWRGNNFINWSEFFSILLWYYVNWNISNIFKIQSVNKSFFNWCYRRQMSNIFTMSLIDRNVFDPVENNWAYNFVGNWNKTYIVYFNHMSSNVCNLSFFNYQVLFEQCSVDFWNLL